jgi:hypothetical protein
MLGDGGIAPKGNRGKPKQSKMHPLILLKGQNKRLEQVLR